VKKEKLLELPLGDRMKYYEKQTEFEISPEEHIVVRIDGHKFSKYTKGFQKPFDAILSKVMELTTTDLVDEFNATTGYTQSDEITLIIPSFKDNTKDTRKSTKHKLQKKVRDNWNHGYSGRVQKMSSLISSFATMSFNEHLKRITYDAFFNGGVETEEDRKYIEKISNEKVGKAWFDARVYGVPSKEEAFNSVLWRIRDAEKNSRSMFAQTYCSHKKLMNKTGEEQVEFCKAETGKDWELVEDRYKYGILVKKERFVKIIEFNEYNNATDVGGVERTRLTSWSQHMVYSDENVDLIMRKVR
jgi:tRNA(His) 5'-end guanylyltransferase